jgi:uncharacterized protein (TIGR02646 family)
MLREQGHLCAYTMVPIRGPDYCHIEHIQPQSLHPRRSVAYNNMVLCVPGNKEEPCAFGAVSKGNFDVSEKTFVSPLRRSCETRLRFTFNGNVSAAKNSDEAAKRTIEILCLNDPSLILARRDAVRLQGIGPYARKPITAAKARRLIETIMRADGSGKIQPYCVAVRQAAEIFARDSEARAVRMARKPTH